MQQFEVAGLLFVCITFGSVEFAELDMAMLHATFFIYMLLIGLLSPL